MTVRKFSKNSPSSFTESGTAFQNVSAQECDQISKKNVFCEYFCASAFSLFVFNLFETNAKLPQIHAIPYASVTVFH
ncbi:hypothetical protein RB195_016882 [Necator americanus]|uniref:Uncharacterized protein n=1 Tax=Necator americanus TaxID=51031 RepID=A0ABR1C5Q8_NECAM